MSTDDFVRDTKEFTDALDRVIREAIRDTLVEIERGCESSATVAQTCADEAASGSAHSPEWFLGWRSAMLSIAEQARMVANGRTLGSPHVTVVDNVFPLRGDRQ